MSLSKESIILVIVANLVLTSLVVAGAFIAFPPKPVEIAPSGTAALQESISQLNKRLEDADRRAEERMLALTDRISELEKAPTAAAPAATMSPANLLAGVMGAAGNENDPTRKFAEGIGKMIKDQAKRQRDRYLEELTNPTEKSESRRTRMFKRVAQDVGRALSLDERDQAEVERILRDVDDRRREDFKALLASKPTPDDISFDEVKDVLDKSYEEEDQMVSNSLGPDQAKEYEKVAEPFRQMIYMGARSAFPGTQPETPEGE